MEKLNELAKRLEKLGYTARVFSTAQEAKDYLLESIPQSDTVGVGGSMTVRQLGLAEALRGRGQQVYWHWDSDDANAARKGAASADTYLCSANAVTESGKIVNIDGYGNRVAPTIYGPQRVFLVVGKNKIAPDLNGAIDRARNIAAPLNARRLNRHTPCAVGEPRCHDCRSPEKICGVMTVFFMPPTSIKEFHVLLVNEDLGY